MTVAGTSTEQFNAFFDGRPTSLESPLYNALKQMITKGNFKQVLKTLGFEEKGQLYTKLFSADSGRMFNNELRVDFKEGKLIYPENEGFKINERQTCNFEHPENFVVFECVYRLLSKGYKPNHIELEPKWQLGHGASGGRADILVRDNNGDALLIIECKTAGTEFVNAWKDTLEDGAQLFSYVQQEGKTQFVALYASDFDGEQVKAEYRLISVHDNAEMLENCKKDVPTFGGATTVKDIFKAWAATYKKEYATKGLFEDDIQPYHIGKQNYTVHDLEIIGSEAISKKYNEFATILRQHNVSGHENAFDKLVNLFLAKVVDETENPENLSFYWKGVAYDDFFSLQDRLQRLYKIGMQRFLNEDVTYIDNEAIKDAFHLFKNDPDATQDKVLDYFRQLKFFTNNDFAFIDVHNEKLFYQNAEVLLKMVKMIQDIRLKTNEQNQFLGDLFEGFLDRGIKQSEGQFFTPLPIVKFLISSLPLEELIEAEIPKVIDYACGAGHFLNEYAAQIADIVMRLYHEEHEGVKNQDPKKLHDYYAEITGIEKEYRLSKVAKVSAFMYGQDQIKIIYADALAENKEVKNNSFSVLVANPPYSVKGFLETLSEDDRERFELFESIDSKQIASNNSIETFFIERAKQLLQADGVAAIILPSSILSNGNIYIRMREISIKYFDIVAIAEFGSGTFGKTGTNTATLFLRRKGMNPQLADHYQNRVNTWFKGDFDKDVVFEDGNLLQAYCDKIGIPFYDYKNWLSDTGSVIDNCEIFKEYRKNFESSTDFKNIQKKRITPKYSEADKQAEIVEAQLEYIKAIEKDKLYYFMLAASNPQPVVIVKSPADNKAMKNFLGYEWSAAKGNEGIKYLGISAADEDDIIVQNKGITQIKTPLFDPNNLSDPTKINSLIRNNFTGSIVQIPADLQPFVSLAKLTDMLDFSRVSFDKAIKTTLEKKIEIVSKYPIVKLVELCGEDNIKRGKSITQKDTIEGDYKVVAGGVDYAYLHNEYNREENTITISASGANAGFVNFWREKIFASDCTTVRGKSKMETEFIFNYLKTIQDKIYLLAKGAAQPHVYPDDIKLLPIPLPPLPVQQQIVSECEKIDNEYNASKMAIEEYKGKIAAIFVRESNNTARALKELCKYSDNRISCEMLTAQNYVGVDNLLQDAQGKTDSEFVLTSGTVTAYKAGDILLSNIRPYLKKIWFADIDGGSSNDVLVLQITSDAILSKYTKLGYKLSYHRVGN